MNLTIDTIEQSAYLEIDGRYRDIAANGSRAVAADPDNRVRIWNLQRGVQEQDIIAGGKIGGIALSHDGNMLAIISAAPLKVSTSGSHNFIATPGAGGTIEIWDLQSRSLIHALGHDVLVSSITWSPSGKSLAINYLGGTQVWNTTSGLLVRTYENTRKLRLSRAVYSHNRRLLAILGELEEQKSIIQIYDLVSDLLLHRLHLSEAVEPTNMICKFSKDNRYLACNGCDEDSGIRVWETASGKLMHSFRGNVGSILDLDFSPDSNLLVSGGLGKNARVWSISSGRELPVLSGHQSLTSSVVFSPHGHFLAVGSMGAVHFWDANHLSLHTQLELDEDFGCPPIVKWAPDGAQLVAMSHSVVQVYTLHTHENTETGLSRAKAGNRNALQNIKSRPLPRYRFQEVPPTEKQAEYVPILFHRTQAMASKLRFPRDPDSGAREYPSVADVLFYEFIKRCELPSDLTKWECSSFIEIFHPIGAYNPTMYSDSCIYLFRLAIRALKDWQANRKPGWNDKHMFLFVFTEAMTWLVQNYALVLEEISDELQSVSKE